MNRPFLLFLLCISFFSCQNPAQNNQEAKSSSTASRTKAWQLNKSGQVSLFAPEDLLTGNEFAISFTPDGREAYFTRTGENGAMTIFQATFDGEDWSAPQVASFSGTHRDADPFVTYDGQRLFFMSFRPRTEDGPVLEAPDIWYVNREGNGWSEPINLEVVNTDFAEGFPSVSLDGTLYFPSNREGNNNDIYMSSIRKGAYTEPIRLSEAINTSASDSNPGISPDGNLLFFYSSREGIQGAVDLFVSQKENGVWTKAVPLGNEINGPHAEYCPYVSPDMNFLFFSRGVRTDTSNTNHIYSIALERVLKALN